MTDNYVQLDPDGSGKKIDVTELTVAGNTVERQRITIGSNSNDGNFLNVNSDGSINVTLPLTAATDASIVTMSNKVPDKGQVSMAQSLPVTIASDQTSIPVSTGLSQSVTDAQLRASPVPVSGSVSTGGLTDTQLRAADVKVSLDGEQVTVANFPATQPISGTVTANTGLSQPVTDTQLRASPVAISGTVTANTGLTQPLTDTQLRASALPVSGTFYPATQSVSAVSLPLPTGAATESTLSSLSTKTPSLGQAAMIASSPVVIASNQSAIPVTGTFWQATQPISGTVTANTGLSQPVTDTQLRATPVPVSGTVTTGGLTDTQLRASAVPISGTVTANTGLDQPLTDTQLRASDVKVSLDGEQVIISNFPATQAISATSLPLPTNAATDDSLTGIYWILVKYLKAIAKPSWFDPSQNRIRGTIAVESGTVTTVGTVSNQTSLGSYNAEQLIRAQARSAWANSVRSTIT